MSSRWLSFLLFLALLVGAERFCHYQTGGFHLSKVVSHLPPDPRWRVDPPSLEERERLQEILDQPFTFLGGGHECYAFVSKDNKYVLKLFKHQFVRLAFIDKALLGLPYMTFFKGMSKAREQRLERTFSSCKIAFDSLQEETGLIALNLAKDWKIEKKVKLIDALNIEHVLDLDKTEFLVQKKVVLAPQKFKELMEKGDVEGATLCIQSLLELFYKRSKRGIFDRDTRVWDNFGFLGNRAVEIDTGSYMADAPQHQTKTFLTDTSVFETWIKKEYPQLLEPFHKSVLNILHGAQSHTL